MNSSALTASLMMATLGVRGQGTITFNNRQTTGIIGQPNEPIYQPIFGINPANPTQVLQGSPNAATAGGNPLPSLGTTDYSGRVLLSGTGFTAQLWYGTVGTTEANLVLASGATSTFRTSATTMGAFNATVATLDNPLVMILGPPCRAVFQVRAWDNKGGSVTTWAALLANNNLARGTSGLFTPNVELCVDGPAPNMIGMESFGLYLVPEPSLIGLGTLALGALLFRRRKG